MPRDEGDFGEVILAEGYGAHLAPEQEASRGRGLATAAGAGMVGAGEGRPKGGGGLGGRGLGEADTLGVEGCGAVVAADELPAIPAIEAIVLVVVVPPRHLPPRPCLVLRRARGPGPAEGRLPRLEGVLILLQDGDLPHPGDVHGGQAALPLALPLEGFPLGGDVPPCPRGKGLPLEFPELYWGRGRIELSRAQLGPALESP